jgi:hypothetical protein
VKNGKDSERVTQLPTPLPWDPLRQPDLTQTGLLMTNANCIDSLRYLSLSSNPRECLWRPAK